jgi:hypothetical protein
MGVNKNAYRVLVWKPEEKWLLGSPECRWQNIKINVKKQDGRVWTGLIWLRIGTSGTLL